MWERLFFLENESSLAAGHPVARQTKAASTFEPLSDFFGLTT